jgi:hypothetical protein
VIFQGGIAAGQNWRNEMGVSERSPGLRLPLRSAARTLNGATAIPSRLAQRQIHFQTHHALHQSCASRNLAKPTFVTVLCQNAASQVDIGEIGLGMDPSISAASRHLVLRFTPMARGRADWLSPPPPQGGSKPEARLGLFFARAPRLRHAGRIGSHLENR